MSRKPEKPSPEDKMIIQKRDLPLQTTLFTKNPLSGEDKPNVIKGKIQ